MNQERKKLGFEIFLSSYFSNFGRIMLINLIFAVPLCISLSLMYLLTTFFPSLTVLLLPLAIVLSFPFYSGVVVLTRNIADDDVPQHVFSEYLEAIRSNWLSFLLHGALLYAASVGSYFSIKTYYILTQTSWFFYIFMFFSVAIALFFLLLFFAAPLMSASFELKIKDVYKNSALMTFGEIKNHFFCIIGCLAFIATVSFPVIAISYLASDIGAQLTKILLIVYISLIVVLILPASVSMIISSSLYQDMKRAVTGEAKADFENKDKEKQKSKAENAAGACDTGEDTGTPRLDIAALKSGNSEYIFHDGKMVKRSALLSELEHREEINNENKQ